MWQLQYYLCRCSFRQDECMVAYMSRLYRSFGAYLRRNPVSNGRGITDMLKFQRNRECYNNLYRIRLHFCGGCSDRIYHFHKEYFYLGARLKPPLFVAQELLTSTYNSFPPFVAQNTGAFGVHVLSSLEYLVGHSRQPLLRSMKQ